MTTMTTGSGLAGVDNAVSWGHRSLLDDLNSGITPEWAEELGFTRDKVLAPTHLVESVSRIDLGDRTVEVCWCGARPHRRRPQWFSSRTPTSSSPATCWKPGTQLRPGCNDWHLARGAGPPAGKIRAEHHHRDRAWAPDDQRRCRCTTKCDPTAVRHGSRLFRREVTLQDALDSQTSLDHGEATFQYRSSAGCAGVDLRRSGQQDLAHQAQPTQQPGRLLGGRQPPVIRRRSPRRRRPRGQPDRDGDAMIGFDPELPAE